MIPPYGIRAGWRVLVRSTPKNPFHPKENDEATMPKGYIIGHITVNDPDAYKEYIERDTPILTALGGQFVVRGGQSEVVEGKTFQRHVVIEFSSYAKAIAAYNDPEYQQVADIRRRTADSVILVVEGV